MLNGWQRTGQYDLQLIAPDLISSKVTIHSNSGITRMRVLTLKKSSFGTRGAADSRHPHDSKCIFAQEAKAGAVYHWEVVWISAAAGCAVAAGAAVFHNSAAESDRIVVISTKLLRDI